MSNNADSIRLLNTAIVKSKEKVINATYNERLRELCERPAVAALSHAIDTLADSQNISRDQAAIQLVETIRELDTVWTDYVLVEGLTSLKTTLSQGTVQ
jgi:hypothetical protein